MSPRELTQVTSVENVALGTSTGVNCPPRKMKPCCRPSALTYRPTISPDGVIAVPSVSFEPGKSKDAKPTPGLPGKWDVVRHWLFWSPSSLVTLVARKPCLAEIVDPPSSGVL